MIEKFCKYLFLVCCLLDAVCSGMIVSVLVDSTRSNWFVIFYLILMIPIFVVGSFAYLKWKNK